MAKKRPSVTRWSQVVQGTKAVTRDVSRAVAAGELRPIGLNLFTPNLDEQLEVLVRRHWYEIVAYLVSGAVVSFRTAIDAKPAADASVFVVGKTRYERDLPGLRIRSVKGPRAQPGDMPLPGGIFIASRPRALLEALKPSRQRKTVSRGLSRAEIEQVLERETRSRACGRRGMPDAHAFDRNDTRITTGDSDAPIGCRDTGG